MIYTHRCPSSTDLVLVTGALHTTRAHDASLRRVLCIQLVATETFTLVLEAGIWEALGRTEIDARFDGRVTSRP